MNFLNTVFTLGTATIGFTLAYWLGALALGRKHRADLIRERLVRMPRPHLAYDAPRFLGT
jgi:hypothetical protein